MVIEVYEKKEIDIGLLIEEIDESLKVSEKEDFIRVDKETAHNIYLVLNRICEEYRYPKQQFNFPPLYQPGNQFLGYWY